MGLYDRYLALRVRSAEGTPPAHVALVITERDLLEPGAYDTLSEFLEWAFAYGAERVTVYVSVLDPEAVAPLRRGLESAATPRDTAVHGPDERTDSDAPIQVSVGLGGKHEFTEAVRSLAEEAANGDLDPAKIDEADIESELVLAEEPDLVIKTGAERLSDFMIWQSVYSELYFTDVNWRDFRKRDYLRAIREYTDRSRRFGQ
ncbi:undecaprenyl diphosphate synthase family protein [Salinarchaeum laminariae]|uniref:undecaprenyl diphosphate synthase family protein n=1 Tax=Salinarchaeum laminariae TaxID=869888 RepID=UPI0020C16D43|nr:undecaprenyl diphosphate synthase family protein [Salinarchaeum laminariae]